MHRTITGVVSVGGMVAVLVFVSSCSPMLPHREKPVEGVLPAEYSDRGSAEWEPNAWWRSFADAELDGLMDRAFVGNLSLQEGLARLRQAEAVAIQAGAGLYPQLSIEGSFTRSWSHTNRTAVGGGFGSAETQSSTYSLGAAASYEVDLWGRVRSLSEAGRLDAEGAWHQFDAMAMTVAAEVASRWLSILEQRAQQKLLAEQLQTNETYLGLVELRFRKSLVSALDVYQQRQVVDQAAGQIPLAQEQEQLLRHQLAVLLGEGPKADVGIGRGELPVLGTLPKTGVPADLLMQRPDVWAALKGLEAADYRVAVARADRLPALRLTASRSYSDSEWEDVFHNWFATFAANVMQPVLDGGRLEAEVARTLAVVEERLATYRQTVLTAIREVEDALVQERKHAEHIEILERQIDNARKALERAGERYRKGVIDYLPVLTQLSTAQRLERDLLSRRLEQLVARVNLYRALGGGVPDDLAQRVARK